MCGKRFGTGLRSIGVLCCLLLLLPLATLSAESNLYQDLMDWETLTDEQKDAWRDYRQALLDVPQQPNFPHEIIWPEAPDDRQL